MFLTNFQDINVNIAVYQSTVIKHRLNKNDFFAHTADLSGLLPEVLNNRPLFDYFEL